MTDRPDPADRPEPALGPVVATTAGQVRGRRWRHGFAFLGLPYAEPPYGERRFAAPVPRAPWSGVRDCLDYGATPQRRPMAEVTAIPEPSIPGDDVLTLNVFTPGVVTADVVTADVVTADVAVPHLADGGTAAPGLPVLVYVHGGGFVAGSPASPWYDGAAYTRDGIVVVTIAYRLAFEGFGHLPGAPANRGVLDQVLALQWVRDNIGAFGGDPTRVTVAGQSAGGGAVMHLMVAPAARGLFSGVIAISGAPGDGTLDQAAASTAVLAEKLGVTADLAGFGAVDELALVDAQGIGAGFGGPPDVDGLLAVVTDLSSGLRMGPVVDGAVLPVTVADGLARGDSSAVPLLVGATRDEFSGLVLGARALFDDADSAALLQRTGLDAAAASRYAALQAGRHPAEVLAQSVTDRMFRRRVMQWAQLRDGAAAPTFVYDFAWRSPVDGLSGHCLDVPFAWDVLADDNVPRLAGENPPQPLADRVHGAYVAFIRDGDPGWPAWSTDGPVMTWDDESVLTDAAAYAGALVLLAPTDG